MADSATDWEKMNVANRYFYREKVFDEKWHSFVLKVWLGKEYVKNEGCLQALPPEVYFVKIALLRKGSQQVSTKDQNIQGNIQVFW